MATKMQDCANNAPNKVQMNYNEELERLRIEGDTLIEHIKEMIDQKTIVEEELKKLRDLSDTSKGIENNDDNKRNKAFAELEESLNKMHNVAPPLSDLEQNLESPVDEGHDVVSDLDNIELYSQQIESAILNSDYETAAVAAHKFLLIDKSALSLTSNNSTDEIFRTIHFAESNIAVLKSKIASKFDSGLGKRDLPSANKFLQMLPLVGEPYEGFERRFCLYAKSKMQVETDRCIIQVTNDKFRDERHGEYSMIYKVALVSLLKGVLEILKNYLSLVETHYESGRLLSVLTYLQNKCDKAVMKLFELWDEERRISKKIKRIMESEKMRTNTRNSNSKIIDLDELDMNINEMAKILRACEEYVTFLKMKVEDAIDEGIQDLKQKADAKKSLEKLINSSGLTSCKQDLFLQYSQFEQYVVKESLTKAVNTDTLNQDGQTSSLVDNMFSIVRKCLRRSISTRNLDSICFVTFTIYNLLDGDFCNILVQKLNQCCIHSHALCKVTLNNVDHSETYLGALCGEAKEDIAKALPNMSDNEREKLESCLSSLSTVTAKFNHIVRYFIRQLYEAEVKPKIIQWVNSFLKYNHKFSKEGFNTYVNGRTFAQSLIANLEALMLSYKDVLIPPNYTLLVYTLMIEVIHRFEAVVMEAKYNRLGGCSLFNDVFKLSDFISKVTGWRTKEEFERLQQMATVLSLETLDEMFDRNKANFQWKLTSTERDKLIGLREDWKYEKKQRD